ncbi:acyltransferase family protein [Pontibacter pudoricolor]|uniref:acyltransferase family protein n=1 Tax=Pontibacter pudoricolor TaxID=2694930 RepID=UPI00139143FE|nr:acyltransferase [Pontibacter pudoricolor]
MEQIDKQLSFKIRLLSLVSMILVVYVHAYTLDLNGYAGALTEHKNYNTFIQDFISHGVARVATPLFFTVSGFLFFIGFKPKAAVILQKINKRISSLLIPFLLWSAFGIGLYYVLQLFPPITPYFPNRIIRDMSFEQLLTTLVLHPIPYQLWFLRDLMILALVAPAVWLFVKYLQENFLALLAVTWFADLDFGIFVSESLLFFSLGCYLKLNPDLVAKLKTNYNFLPVLLGWLGLLIFKTELSFLGYDNQLVLMLLHKLAIVTGFVATWQCINRVVDKTRIVNRKWLFSAVSPFFIYAFHEPLLTICKKGLLLILYSGTDITSLLVYLFAPIVVILASIMAGEILRRTTPGFFQVITGNRDKPAESPLVNTPAQTQLLVKTQA